MDKDSRQIFESYRLINESTDFEVGKKYKCEDLFKVSNYKNQDFYHVKAGFDKNKYANLFRKFKKGNPSAQIEVYGFKNLTNPKLEYHLSYLFRITSTVNILSKINTDLQYDSGILFVPYSDEGIVVPDDEGLYDEMKCDLFLPHIEMKPETRKHFGDIFSAVD